MKPLIDLTYTENDGLFYPNLQISENADDDIADIGKYGRLWKEYMADNYAFRVSELIATGLFNRLLMEVDKEAEERKEAIIQKLLKDKPLPQTDDFLERAGIMYAYCQMAEETILDEIVFKPR